MASEPYLDHLALAAEDAWDNFDRYAGDLGGQFVSGAVDPGFYWGQVRFANGMRVELLEPDHPEQFDFLRRFLDRNGPGPHHITVKVPDLDATVATATGLGYTIASRNEGDTWREAFLHPKSSHGIVVQLTEVPGTELGVDDDGSEDPDLRAPLAGMVPGRRKEPATLERLVHLVADLDRATELFDQVLGASTVGEGEFALGTARDMTWPGPGRITLLQPSADAALAWMGDRPGRLHHVEFRLADPGGVRGAHRIAANRWEVRPEHNLGTRLHLLTT
jgi:catechol 2,3-dioxygenase-like lactoylglutathione lyase family enzyme